MSMAFWSATRTAKAIRSGEVSVQQVLHCVFEQIDRHNPSLNAVVWQDREGALRKAAHFDQCIQQAGGRFDLDLDWRTAKPELRPLMPVTPHRSTKSNKVVQDSDVKHEWVPSAFGPLYGVPVTIKEAFDLEGSPSTWGNPLWANSVAASDADAVQRLKQAGAIIIGKTNVPLMLVEWQTFNEVYGTTHNPWDKSRTPGGSSGGSAVALASGMSMLELGSDIGSSIRNPAHYCGVFGLKPSWNSMSMQGHAAQGELIDIDIGVGGPMARSAEDLSLSWDVLAGASRFHRDAWQYRNEPDHRTKLSQFKVVVKYDDDVAPVDRAYVVALEWFVQCLQERGVTVLETRFLPQIDSDEHYRLYMKLLGAAMSLGVTEEGVEAACRQVAAVKDPRVKRYFGERIAAQSLKHREWLALDQQRRLHRLEFDRAFEAAAPNSFIYNR